MDEAGSPKRDEPSPKSPRARRLWRWVLLRWSLLYMCVWALGSCGWLADRLLLFPSHDPIESIGARKVLNVESGPLAGRGLELFVHRLGGESAQEPALYVVALTGNGGRAELMVEYTRALFSLVRSLDPPLDGSGPGSSPTSIEVIAVQHPGYGADTGRASLPLIGEAAVLAVRHVRARAGQRPIIVHGLSLGSAAALHAARTLGAEAIQGLLIEKPPDLRSLILKGYGWWNLWLLAGPIALFLPESALSIRSAAAIGEIPALFILSDRDEVVPRWNAERVAEAYAGPSETVISSTYHNEMPSPANAPGLVPALQRLVESAARLARER